MDVNERNLSLEKAFHSLFFTASSTTSFPCSFALSTSFCALPYHIYNFWASSSAFCFSSSSLLLAICLSSEIFFSASFDSLLTSFWFSINSSIELTPYGIVYRGQRFSKSFDFFCRRLLYRSNFFIHKLRKISINCASISEEIFRSKPHLCILYFKLASRLFSF